MESTTQKQKQNKKRKKSALKIGDIKCRGN